MPAKALRATNPDKIAYVRVATTDDIQGAGGADIAYNTIGAKTAYVLDDTQTYGKGIADGFTDAFTKLGGTVVERDGVPDTTTDFTSYVTKVKGLNPDVVILRRRHDVGPGPVPQADGAAGPGDIPIVGGDGINDGSAATASSFLNIAGDGGDRTRYSTVAAIHDIPEPGEVRGRLQGQVQRGSGLLQRPGLRLHAGLPRRPSRPSAPSAGGDMAQLREAIRAYVADPANTYDTVLGKVGFDADGDTSQQIDLVLPVRRRRRKDWKFLKQRDFTADPVK